VNNYFNLINDDIQRLIISATNAQNNCFIHDIKSKSIIYDEFILNENTKSKIICKITFYPHTITDKYIPRLTLRKVDKQFEQTQTKKDIIIALDKSELASRFWKLINFLKNYKDLVDCGDFEKTYKVVKEDFITEFKTKSQKDKLLEISKIIEESDLSSQDILNTILLKERKKNLKAFDGFLNNKDIGDKSFFKSYKEKFNIKQNGEEVVWHHFLKEHNWIIGLNADIRFTSDLISEQKAGIENSEGRNSPKIDLLGRLSNFIILIELKTANTNIFTKQISKTARANTWSFTSDFIDGISQCLGQKFSFDKSYDAKDFIDDNGNQIDKRKVRTVDPKILFIIGNRQKEFPLDGSQDNITKNDTFERFRRNNKHIEIITFDELYERAKYIVNQADNIKYEKPNYDL